MGNIKHISIPQPCNQPWQQMSLTADGRYCANCSKTVVDFTTMSSNEIINYLNKHSNVCGNLKESQIDMLNGYPSTTKRIHTNNYRKWTIAVSFLWTICALKTFAQKATASQEQTIVDKQSNNKSLFKNATDITQNVTIKGKITDSLKFYIMGADITSLPSGKKTKAGENGLFELIIPATDKQLQIYRIGFIRQLIYIDKARHEYNIILKKTSNVIGEIIVMPKPINH